jgi:glycerol-3-phosphate dehydrogenase (NAD(P)+)
MRKDNISPKTFQYFNPDIKIAGVGLGPFGLVNYKHLTELGYSVKAYDKDENIVKHIQKTGRHPYHFQHIHVSDKLEPVNTLEEAVDGADLVILAVDSQNLRKAATAMKGKLKHGAVLLNLAKGLELGESNTTGKAKPLSDVEKESLEEKNFSEGSNFHLAAGQGGVFAVDLAVGANVYMTMASRNTAIANDLSKIFRSERYHTQPWDDVRGVELAGAIKNVIAIGKGMGDEIRKIHSTFFGIKLKYLPFERLLNRKNDRFQIEHSSLCGSISAYMNEMTDLAVELGAKRETFSMGVYACGGDLMTTCFSDESRNVRFGRRIVSESKKSSGLTPGEIYEEMRRKRKTVEGFPATKAFYEIAHSMYKSNGKKEAKPRRYALVDQTYKVLFENKDPEKSIECLARYASLI